ncbi:hypothetical protein M3C31_00060 [Staphylococcus hominis]|uniref:hypothetical protein n=1 Tax=Staphylococcus hominis TaxID=1290 RepID=UPI0021A38E5C|nr:hypothetical protein [Staphylococcus hominis]MCT1482240.1 hypothetical protein [Staphylococcus hominis]
MLKKFLALHPNEIFVKLFIILLAGLGVTRSYSWIVADVDRLQSVSKLYIKMSKYMDIHAIGWILIIFSGVLFLSAFFDKSIGYWLLVIGSLACSVIHILFAMISVTTANVATTYYINMLIGCIQLMVAVTGVITLWKMKN